MQGLSGDLRTNVNEQYKRNTSIYIVKVGQKMAITSRVGRCEFMDREFQGDIQE